MRNVAGTLSIALGKKRAAVADYLLGVVLVRPYAANASIARSGG
jgi:hypothetical protein